jgi:hypothetical protein
MQSHTTERFRKAFKQLPLEVQETARKAYLLLEAGSATSQFTIQADPRHEANLLCAGQSRMEGRRGSAA